MQAVENLKEAVILSQAEVIPLQAVENLKAVILSQAEVIPLQAVKNLKAVILSQAVEKLLKAVILSQVKMVKFQNHLGMNYCSLKSLKL